MATHRDDVPCVPFDQCPSCLALRQAQRAGGTPRQMHTEDWFPMFEELQKNRFMAERVAWHLGNDCDTPEKARELALKEWRVGVLGEVVP